MHVDRRHPGVGRIRHRRVEVVAIRRHALAHGPVKLPEAVLADAGFEVWRDIGGIERAEGRLQRPAAGHGCALVHTFLRRMAGHAIARLGQVAAPLHGRITRGRRAAGRRKQGHAHQDQAGKRPARVNTAHGVLLPLVLGTSLGRGPGSDHPDIGLAK